jgi:hypothetical protein
MDIKKKTLCFISLVKPPSIQYEFECRLCYDVIMMSVSL